MAFFNNDEKFLKFLREKKVKWSQPITANENIDKVLRLHWILGIFEFKAKSSSKFKSWAAVVLIFVSSVVIVSAGVTGGRRTDISFTFNWGLIMRFFSFILIYSEMIFIVKSSNFRNFIKISNAHLGKYNNLNMAEFTAPKIIIKLIFWYRIAVFIVILISAPKIVATMIAILMDDLPLLDASTLYGFVALSALAFFMFVRLVILALLAGSQDILVPCAIIELEKVFFLLTKKLQLVTNYDGSTMKENEQKLGEFVKLHIESLAVVRSFKKCFSHSIIFRVYSVSWLITLMVYDIVSYILS